MFLKQWGPRGPRRLGQGVQLVACPRSRFETAPWSPSPRGTLTRKSWVDSSFPHPFSLWFSGHTVHHSTGAGARVQGDLGLLKTVIISHPNSTLKNSGLVDEGCVCVSVRVDSSGPYNTFARPTLLCFDRKKICSSIREAKLAMVFSRRSLFYLRFKSEGITQALRPPGCL